jgi:hypothetical protein
MKKLYKLLVKPYISEPEKPSLNLLDGNNIQLKCALKYDSLRNLTWSWKRNNLEIKYDLDRIKIDNSVPGESVVFIKSASFADDGVYRCSISDDIANNEMHFQEIKLNIKSM